MRITRSVRENVVCFLGVTDSQCLLCGRQPANRFYHSPYWRGRSSAGNWSIGRHENHRLQDDGGMKRTGSQSAPRPRRTDTDAPLAAGQSELRPMRSPLPFAGVVDRRLPGRMSTEEWRAKKEHRRLVGGDDCQRRSDESKAMLDNRSIARRHLCFRREIENR